MQKTIIYLTLLIEVLGISIIIPAFPELKTYYGVGDFAITVGLAIYSLCVFLTAPILGQLSDRYGRKQSLGLCIAGTAASYLILLIQPRYRIFLLSRIINGITGGNISIIQAIITDISPDTESKNKNFGLLGAMFGLGFIIGPVLGSILLSRGGVEMIFRGGGILALLQSIMLWRQFHNTNTPNPHKSISYNTFTTLKTYILRPSLTPWLLSFVMIGIGAFIINSSQSLYMASYFGTPGTRYGFYLAGLGVISAINMAILVPRVWTHFFSTRQLLIIIYSGLIVGYLIASLMSDEISYIAIFLLSTIISGPYQVIYQQHIMSQAQAHEVGELSGALGSISSIGMIIGPLIGGTLLQYGLDIHRGSVIFIFIAAWMMRDHFRTSHG